MVPASTNRSNLGECSTASRTLALVSASVAPLFVASPRPYFRFATIGPQRAAQSSPQGVSDDDLEYTSHLVRARPPRLRVHDAAANADALGDSGGHARSASQRAHSRGSNRREPAPRGMGENRMDAKLQ